MQRAFSNLLVTLSPAFYASCHSSPFTPCHSEPFIACHSERSEESHTSQGKFSESLEGILPLHFAHGQKGRKRFQGDLSLISNPLVGVR